MMSKIIKFIMLAGAGLALSGTAYAQDAAVNSGDTAWILTATALVLSLIHI